MPNIILGVTGSVAAIHTPLLYGELRQADYTVKIVATKSACYFFDVNAIEPKAPGQRNRKAILLDEDEWPRTRYQQGDPVLHIELRRWGDVLLVAPLDANTLAKFATGICDNCLTCLYRAWDRKRPVVLAPAMNSMMWEHPATERHIVQVMDDLDKSLRIVEPIEKKLACDDVGMGALAERGTILAALSALGL